MDEPPLSVAIAAVVEDGEILLIKRERGDYTGYWALPGGKVETGEHVSEAAEREIREETGVETEFRDRLGTVSEHLVDGELEKHFLLHVFELAAESRKVESGEEGEVEWLPMEEVEDERIIPSDTAIIEEIVRGDGGYRECVIDKPVENTAWKSSVRYSKRS